MNGLTLKELRKAATVVGTSKRFKSRPAGTDQQLQRAIVYMSSSKARINEPRDPREVLREIGYKF